MFAITVDGFPHWRDSPAELAEEWIWHGILLLSASWEMPMLRLVIRKEIG